MRSHIIFRLKIIFGSGLSKKENIWEGTKCLLRSDFLFSLYHSSPLQVTTWAKHSYQVISSHIKWYNESAGASEVVESHKDTRKTWLQWKSLKKSKTGNEPKLKDPNISMRFKSDFSHVPLLAEPQNQI